MLKKHRRFFREVTVEADGPRYWVRLDDDPVKTPDSTRVLLPARGLADAIAAEWAAQVDEVDPRSMPMTRLACAAIDIVTPHRTTVIEELAAYARTDLLCYRADHPPELADRQHMVWQPLLDWAAAAYGAQLAVTDGVVYVEQSADALSAYRAAIEAWDDMSLAAIQTLVQATGSIVIGLALVTGRLSTAEAAAASRVDEIYQAERWGEDPEASARRGALDSEIEAAARFIALIGKPTDTPV